MTQGESHSDASNGAKRVSQMHGLQMTVTSRSQYHSTTAKSPPDKEKHQPLRLVLFLGLRATVRL